MKYDCLLIGHNDIEIKNLYLQLRAMGDNHADFRDLDINVINYKENVLTVMDAVNYFRYDKEDLTFKLFNNGDLLWNVILYLGSYLTKYQLTFDYINHFNQEKEQLLNKLNTSEFVVIAITTTVYTMVEPVIEIIKFIRNVNKSCKIVVGGPLINKQVNAMSVEDSQLFFKLIDADIYINEREGEKTLVEVIRVLKSNGDLLEIPNVIIASEKSYIVNQVQVENNELNDNPIDYSLFHPNDFKGSMNIRISKGCPYNCSFCGFPKRSNSYKFLDVDNIIDELDKIDALDISNVFFMDDSVNIPKPHFKKLLVKMIERNYRFRWNCFFRCDQCDDEIIKLMKEAKCEGVFLGLESTDEIILKNMNKSSRKEHFEQTIPVFLSHGMNVFVSIFTGFPGETWKTFHNTIDFIENNHVDFYRPQLWYCDPVTPIYEKREEYGIVGSNFSWKHNTMSVSEACDLNEWAFFYLNETVWTPDPGFNFISIYYMKKRGYEISEIKDLLISFNNVVKLKLMGSRNKEFHNTAISNLKFAINRENEKIDRVFINNFSGMSYKITEAYIQKEFMQNDNMSYVKSFDHISSYKSIKLNVKNSDKQKLYEIIRIKAIRIIYKALGIEELNIVCFDRDRYIPLRIDSQNYSQEELQDMINSSYDYGIFGIHIFAHSKQYINNNIRFNLLVSQRDFSEEYDEDICEFDLNVIYQETDDLIIIKYNPSKFTVSFIEKFADLLTSAELSSELDEIEQLTKKNVFNINKNFTF